jgi:hypothetical protein
MNVPQLDKFTYKMAISTPAHFTGQILTDSFWLTGAHPLHKNNIEIFDISGRFSRNFFVLTFRDRRPSEEDEKIRQPPYYGWVGDYFCVFLSVYFGKRFDNLGFFQTNGSHSIPDIPPSKLRKLTDALPTNSRPRKDLEIKLALHESKPLFPILEAVFLEINKQTSVSKDLELAYAAGSSYLQALQLFESDPEHAFLSLINAGEVIINGLEFAEDEIYDKDTQELLAEIKQQLGDVKAKRVRERFFQIRRKFRVGLSRLVNKSFFEGSESQDDSHKFKPEDFDVRIAAAYDLRSHYLHAGKRFEEWVTIFDHWNAEVCIETPFYGDAEWKKLIARIPTLVGMERVIRFCLLRFMHQKVAFLHEKLN